jgi:hypothetical protein
VKRKSLNSSISQKIKNFFCQKREILKFGKKGSFSPKKCFRKVPQEEMLIEQKFKSRLHYIILNVQKKFFLSLKHDFKRYYDVRIH